MRTLSLRRARTPRWSRVPWCRCRRCSAEHPAAVDFPKPYPERGVGSAMVAVIADEIAPRRPAAASSLPRDPRARASPTRCTRTPGIRHARRLGARRGSIGSHARALSSARRRCHSAVGQRARLLRALERSLSGEIRIDRGARPRLQTPSAVHRDVPTCARHGAGALLPHAVLTSSLPTMLDPRSSKNGARDRRERPQARRRRARHRRRGGSRQRAVRALRPS